MYTRSFDVVIGFAVQKFASSLAGEWSLNKFVYCKRLCKPCNQEKELTFGSFCPLASKVSLRMGTFILSTLRFLHRVSFSVFLFVVCDRAWELHVDPLVFSD